MVLFFTELKRRRSSEIIFPLTAFMSESYHILNTVPYVCVPWVVESAEDMSKL